jgi:hypothetical protein
MSSIVISGDTSGSVTLDAPAVAGSTVLTLPVGTGVVSANNVSSNIVARTAQASTSGTSIDFTGIPSWVKRITIMFDGVSTNGASNPLIQIGDSGGIENTGYLGSSTNIATGGSSSVNYTSGFGILSSGSTNVIFGHIILTNFSANVWVNSASIAFSNAATNTISAGSKTLSDVLTQVRITTVNGTDAFDAGTINILYE